MTESCNIKLDKFQNRLIDSLQGEGFICGGYARYIIDPSKTVEDIDIYTPCPGSLASYIANNFKIKSSIWMKDIIQIFIEESSHPIQIIKYTTDKYTYSDPERYVKSILNTYDLSICQAGILNSKEAYITKEFKDSLVNNKIKVIKYSKYTESRLIKYLMRGYDLNILDCCKLLKSLDKLTDAEKFKLVGYINYNDEFKLDSLFGGIIIQGIGELYEHLKTIEI